MTPEQLIPFLNSDSEIPDEIIWEMVKFLDIYSLQKLAHVNKRAYSIVKSHMIKLIPKATAALGYHVVSDISKEEFTQMLERNVGLTVLFDLLTKLKYAKNKNNIKFFSSQYYSFDLNPLISPYLKTHIDLLKIKPFLSENLNSNIDNPIMLLNFLNLDQFRWNPNVFRNVSDLAENLWYALLAFKNSNLQSITALAYIHKFWKYKDDRFNKFVSSINEIIKNRSECIRQWLIYLCSDLKAQIVNIESNRLIALEKLLPILLPDQYFNTCTTILLLIKQYGLENFLDTIANLESEMIIDLFNSIPPTEEIIKQITLNELKNLPHKFSQPLNFLISKDSLKHLWELVPQLSANELSSLLTNLGHTKESIITVITENKISLDHLKNDEISEIFKILFESIGEYAEDEDEEEDEADICSFHIFIQLASSYGLHEAKKFFADITPSKNYDLKILDEIIIILGSLDNPTIKLILNNYRDFQAWLNLYQEKISETQPSEEAEVFLEYCTIHSIFHMLMISYPITQYFFSKTSELENLPILIHEDELTKKIISSGKNKLVWWRKFFSLVNPYKFAQLGQKEITSVINIYNYNYPGSTNRYSVFEKYTAYIINNFSTIEKLLALAPLLQDTSKDYRKKIATMLEYIAMYYREASIYTALSYLVPADSFFDESGDISILELIIRLDVKIFWPLIDDIFKNLNKMEKLTEANFFLLQKIILLNRDKNFQHAYTTLGHKIIKQTIQETVTPRHCQPLNFWETVCDHLLTTTFKEFLTKFYIRGVFEIESAKQHFVKHSILPDQSVFNLKGTMWNNPNNSTHTDNKKNEDTERHGPQNF